jgi:cysteine desulfurase
MIMHLDMAGVACSSGSACTTGSIEPSHVLSAMGMPKDLAVATLRFSFFKQNTVEDVDRVMEVLPGVVERVRKLGAALGR